MHGGRSVGGYWGQPLGPAWRASAKKQALFRALGLPWYGGAPRRAAKVRTMVDEAKVALAGQIVELQAIVPAEVMTKAVDELSAPEALDRAALSGARQLVQIVEREIDWDELKQVRLIGDMAAVAMRLSVRVSEGQFRARRDDALARLLASLARDDQK